MTAFVAKSSQVFSALLAAPRAAVRVIMRIPEALVDAIERHALEK